MSTTIFHSVSVEEGCPQTLARALLGGGGGRGAFFTRAQLQAHHSHVLLHVPGRVQLSHSCIHHRISGVPLLPGPATQDQGQESGRLSRRTECAQSNCLRVHPLCCRLISERGLASRAKLKRGGGGRTFDPCICMGSVQRGWSVTLEYHRRPALAVAVTRCCPSSKREQKGCFVDQSGRLVPPPTSAADCP